MNKHLLSGNILVLIGIGCSLIFLLIINPSLYYFLNDDFIHIPLASKKNFLHGHLIRPLADFTLWLDYQIWGKQAFGYHLTNVLIHLITSCLVYILSGRIFQIFNQENNIIKKKALFASFLFLIYAFHSEPVLWIIGRGGSLSTLFFVAAFICFLSKKRFYYFLSFLFFLIGLFVYECIWVYPAIITILFAFKKETGSLKKIACIWSVFLIYICLRLYIIGGISNGYAMGIFYNLSFSRILYNYNTLIARNFIPPMESTHIFVFSYILLFSFLVYLCKRLKSSVIYFLIGCLLVSVLPVLSLGIDTHDSESERFIYLSSVFAIFLITEIIFYLRDLRLFLTGSLILLAHIFIFYKAALTYQVSGNLTKTSLSCIGPLQVKNLVVQNLPTHYKGALIFRLGFKEAVQWLLEQELQSVKVVSQMEYKHPPELLKCNQMGFLGNKSNDTLFLKWSKIDLLKY